MRILASAAAAVFLTGTASAQTQIGPPATLTQPSRQQLYDPSQFRAPVRPRQPAPEIKSEEPVIDPIEDLARENAMLARRINGICRGC